MGPASSPPEAWRAEVRPRWRPGQGAVTAAVQEIWHRCQAPRCVVCCTWPMQRIRAGCRPGRGGGLLPPSLDWAGLSLLRKWTRTGFFLGCCLVPGMWHLALDSPDWHCPLCRSGAAGRRLGTGLASYPPDGACSVLRRRGWPTLVQDGSLLDGESLTPQGIKTNILLTHSSIGGFATADVHHC